MLAEEIVQVATEALRAYGLRVRKLSPSPQNLLNDTKFILANPKAGDEGVHKAWYEAKLLDGWTYGETYDPANKRSPHMVPFDDLPEEDQAEDRLFRAVVLALGPQ